MAKKSAKKEKNPFKISLKERLHEIVKARTFSALANILFGHYVDKNPELFYSIKDDLDKSGFNVLSRTYFCGLFFYPLLAYILSLIMCFSVFLVNSMPFAFRIVVLTLAPFTISLFVFTVLYLFPSMKVRSRDQNITHNLPFALNHMSAVTGSGIPPSALFELMTNFEEYGELSKEANKILKRIRVFGEDLITSLKNVAKSTPSEEFREVIYGIISTLESGGSLKDYLQERSKTALFEYKLKREKYIKNLSVYASIYTAILVAAPLFMIAILALLNLMGGTLVGFEIKSIMYAGVYVIIPVINSIFLLFLLWVQKEV